MKIKSILITVVVMAIIAVVSYFPTGSIRGRKSLEQQNRTPAKRADHSEKIRQIEDEYRQKQMDIERRFSEKIQQVSQNRQATMQTLDAEDRADRDNLKKDLRKFNNEKFGPTASSGSSRTIAMRKGQAMSDYRENAEERGKAAGIANDDYGMDMEYFQKQKELALSDLQKEKERAIAAVYNEQAGEPNETNPDKAMGTVRAITSSDGTAMAVIDGQVLREGQSIRGVKITKITPSCVEFNYAGKTWSQRINEQPLANWQQQ